MAKKVSQDSPAPNSTSPATRNASQRSVERRREREDQKRRQRQLYIIGAVVVVILMIVGIFLTVNAPADAPIPETATTRYENILSSKTVEGYPRLGSTDARVIVSYYASFDCPDCRLLENNIIDDVLERVRNESISFIYIPQYGVDNTVVNGFGAARAALCAGEQNRFWAFREALYEWQVLYPANQAYTHNRIVTGVDALGLNRAQYDGCVSSGSMDGVLNDARSATTNLIGYTGAPAVSINGVLLLDEEGVVERDPEAIIAAIDRSIATFGTRPAPEVTAQPEVTPEATAEATPDAEETAVAEVEVTSEPADETDAEVTPEATEAS